MIDENTVYLIILFVFWLYLVDLSITKKEVGYKYLQFVFMFPLVIYFSSLAFVQNLVFGYAISFVIGIFSLYVLSSYYIGKYRRR